MSSPTQFTRSTRFLILSDTHNFEFGDSCAGPLRLPLPKVDVILHCGDLTYCGGASSYKKLIKMLAAMDAELKIVIAGNHDIDLDEKYWKTHLDEDDEPEDHSLAVNIMTGSLAAKACVTYLEEGTYTFTLKNGAKFSLYASPYSPAFCDWAFAYEHDEDRFNGPHCVADGVKSIATNPIPNDVDIVMTHGPPKGILDVCPQGSVGCKNILQAMRRVRPRLHCFGHVHPGNGMKVEDWGSTTRTVSKEDASKQQEPLVNLYPNPMNPALIHGQQSLMVNAAIMDDHNNPVNTPWLVDLELPLSPSTS
jgi:3',5'-cyclic AMP phosphodiesterase CpdA